MKITAADLRAMNACLDHVQLFTSRWPDGVEVSVENLIEGYRLSLDVDWWAQKTFGAELERQRAPLWAEYERQRAPLLAEYERQRAVLIMSLLVEAVAPEEE